MPSKADSPKVSAVVNEDDGTVTVGVEHEGAFLPVASANLDYAKALGLNAKGEPASSEKNKGGEA